MPTRVNNQRITKNTLLLYGRMQLIMAVSLYISRVVLNTLGVEDYGIYNVVGGIVMMLVFFSMSMVYITGLMPFSFSNVIADNSSSYSLSFSFRSSFRTN